MVLIKVQQNAVKELLTAYENHNKKKKAWFQTPIGSGKILMISEFISQVLQKWANSERKTIIVFMTVSTAALPKQLATKLKTYQKFHQFNNYKIEFIDAPSRSQRGINNLSEFKIENNKIFVFGAASFAKKTLFYENKTLETFLNQLKALDYNLIFILDESYVSVSRTKAVNKELVRTIDQKLDDAAEFILTVTTTPPRTATNLIKITDMDLEDGAKRLLKSNMVLNYHDFVKEAGKGIVSDAELLDFVIQKFKKSQKEYASLALSNPIRPALLIPIGNEARRSNHEKKQFQNHLQLLEKKLQEHNLTYLVYFRDFIQVRNSIFPDLPATLEYAAKNNSWIDAIIYKSQLLIGYNIPRANTLVQLRSIGPSYITALDLSKIRRNPYPNLEYNEVTDKYFAYFHTTLIKEDQKDKPDLINYVLEDNFKGKSFQLGKIILDPKSEKAIIDKYKKRVFVFIHSDEFRNMISNLDNGNIASQIKNIITNKRTINYPNNAVELKIFNQLNFQSPDAKELLMTEFFEELKKVRIEISFELVKFCFASFKDVFSKYMHEARQSIEIKDTYQIMDSKEIPTSYNISLVSKRHKILSNVQEIINYGYKLAGRDTNIQYLDSWPEKLFLDTFKWEILKDQKIKLDFFAKLPKRGGIYFQYKLSNNNKIKNSYIDFIIEYRNRIIMVIVIDTDSTSHQEEIDNLKKAYQEYMIALKKQHKKTTKQVCFLIYSYNHEHGYHVLDYLLEDTKWKEVNNFVHAFEDLFDIMNHII